MLENLSVSNDMLDRLGQCCPMSGTIFDPFWRAFP